MKQVDEGNRNAIIDHEAKRKELFDDPFHRERAEVQRLVTRMRVEYKLAGRSIRYIGPSEATADLEVGYFAVFGIGRFRGTKISSDIRAVSRCAVRLSMAENATSPRACALNTKWLSTALAEAWRILGENPLPDAMTVTQAADYLINAPDTCGLISKNKNGAKALIEKWIKAGTLRTNGAEGHYRRVSQAGINSHLLRIRDEANARDNEKDD